MTISIQIGGMTYTSSDPELDDGLDWTTLSIEDVMAPTGDLASVQGVFRTAEKIPLTEQEMVVTFDGTTIFGGVVEEVEYELYAEGTVLVTVTARDYTKWLNQKLVSGVFVDLVAEDMVKSIVNTFAPSISTTGVNDTTSILPKVFNFISVGEALQEIADIVGAIWYVDFNRVLHFVQADNPTNISPLAVYDVDDEMNVGNLRFSKSTEDIQNSLVVKDFVFRGPNIFYEPGGDGFPVDDTGIDVTEEIKTRKRIDLQFTPYDLEDFVFEINETPGSDTWVTKAAQWDIVTATPGDDPSNLNTNFVYVNAGRGIAGQSFVRWSFDLSTGDDIRISYRPLLANIFPELTREVFSIDEFARRESEGRSLAAGQSAPDGIYERLIYFRDLEFAGTDPLQDMITFGTSILDLHAWPVVEGTFETRSNLIDGWRAGQRMFITSEEFDIFDLQKFVQQGGNILSPPPAKSPLPIWVKAVRIQPISYNELRYRITFTTQYKSI